MKWPWQRSQPDYTAQRLGEHTEHASLGTVGQQALPVIQACLSLWERGIGSVRMTQNMRVADLHGHMSMIGRSLALKGEAAFLIEPMGSRVRLRPASTLSVIGPDDPEKWLYLITLAAPSGTSTYRVLGERVLHFRVGASVQEPWRGRSPLTENCVKLPAAIENVLRKEAALLPGKIFKIATLSVGSEQHQEFIKMVRKGGVSALSMGAEQLEDVMSYGPRYDAPIVSLRDQLSNSVLAAYGVPPALLDVRPSGNSAREAARRFYAGTIMPIVTAMQREIEYKLAPGIMLDVPVADMIDEDVRSRAITRRAEAAMKLKELGMANAEALRVAGIDGVSLE